MDAAIRSSVITAVSGIGAVIEAAIRSVIQSFSSFPASCTIPYAADRSRPYRFTSSFAAALGFSAEPMVEAMVDADGVSLSGTGPSVTAVGNRDDLDHVRERWEQRAGRTWYTTTQRDGARTI